jgi:hypothetical protein
MCLQINPCHFTKQPAYTHPDKPYGVKPYVSHNGIKVYKVLRNPFSLFDKDYLTPFQHKRIRFNKKGECTLTSEVIAVQTSWWYSFYINEGIHAWTSKKEAEYWVLHHDGLLADERYTIFEAVIPAGAEYYLGLDHDVVTNKLIIYENN